MAASPANERPGLSRRAYSVATRATSWEEIWDAGPYYERISVLLENARESVILSGWQLDSRLPLPIPPEARAAAGRERETLKAKLLRLCDARPGLRIYLLMWAHSYLYVIERELWQARIWENLHPRIHLLFDNRHPFGASHHEKLCLIDGEIALCGGIDLCDERWDSAEHLYRDHRRSLDWREEHHGPYHDFAVQVSGPVCAPLHAHLRQRWESLSSIPFPALPRAAGASASFQGQGEGHRVYLSRTLVESSARRLPKVTREIEFTFRELIASARHRIILEGQYYWSREINDLLIARMADRSGHDFEIVLVLSDLRRIKSFTRLMARYQLELLRELQLAATRFGTRLRAGTPCVPPPPGEAGAKVRPVYVHSKLVLVDDRFLSIGSANLATRALRVDTEINLTLEAVSARERAHLRRVGQAVLAHWGLGEPPPGQPRSGAYLQLTKAGAELERLRHLPLRKSLALSLPWELFFDPPLPWLAPLVMPLQRAYRGRLRRLLDLVAWFFAVLAALGAASWLLSGLGPAPLDAGTALLFAVWFAAAWALGLPLAAPATLAAAGLGVEVATRGLLPVYALFCLLAYSRARYLGTGAPVPRPGAGGRFERLLGARDFPRFLQALAIPALATQRKVASQGAYCVPFAWFVLGNCLLVPAVFYSFGLALMLWLPPGAQAFVRQNTLGLLLLTLLPRAFRFLKDRKSRRRAGATEEDGEREEASAA